MKRVDVDAFPYCVHLARYVLFVVVLGVKGRRLVAQAGGYCSHQQRSSSSNHHQQPKEQPYAALYRPRGSSRSYSQRQQNWWTAHSRSLDLGNRQQLCTASATAAVVLWRQS
jgi:hypothetical protein